ncbi:MAG: hypothetical protein HC852_23545 [Acaryochloridaceae cyanobacterium RU_4_10]|nr:hypothetical protein [Acaryochloridaceae cyanobacterium RU_4_10]
MVLPAALLPRGVVVVEPSKLVLKLQNDFTVAQQVGDRPLVSSAQNLR